MQAVDLLALVLVLGLLAIGGRSIFLGWNLAAVRRREKLASERRMRDDLRTALGSHDQGKLEDFLVLWGDTIDKKTRDHIKARIDDLVIGKEM